MGRQQGDNAGLWAPSGGWALAVSPFLLPFAAARPNPSRRIWQNVNGRLFGVTSDSPLGGALEVLQIVRLQPRADSPLQRRRAKFTMFNDHSASNAPPCQKLPIGAPLFSSPSCCV
jgi:hypothetical protein